MPALAARTVHDAKLTASLVPAAEESATPEALALLRILAAIGTPALKTAATEAADRVTASGVTDPDWAARIGSPTVGRCWHYSDVGGRQESVTVSFGYGDAEHALSVLIDHGQGGKIKDAWVDSADGLLDKTWMAAENDPLVVFEPIEAADARTRLETGGSRRRVPRQARRGRRPDRPPRPPPRPRPLPSHRLTSERRPDRPAPVGARIARLSSQRRPDRSALQPAAPATTARPVRP